MIYHVCLISILQNPEYTTISEVTSDPVDVYIVMAVEDDGPTGVSEATIDGEDYTDDFQSVSEENFSD